MKSSAFDDKGCNGHNRDGGYDDGDHDADRELILVAVIDDQRAFGQCVHREVHQCELECPGGLIVSLLHLLQPFDPDRYSVVVRYIQLLLTFKSTTVGLRGETFHCI